MDKKNIFRYNPKTGVLTPGHGFRVMTPNHLTNEHVLTPGHLVALTPGHLFMTPGHGAAFGGWAATRLQVERDEDDNLIITLED